MHWELPMLSSYTPAVLVPKGSVAGCLEPKLQGMMSHEIWPGGTSDTSSLPHTCRANGDSIKSFYRSAIQVAFHMLQIHWPGIDTLPPLCAIANVARQKRNVDSAFYNYRKNGRTCPQ